MPQTSNILLEVPNTGALVGTWGSQAVNPNMTAIDGMLAGVGIVSLSNSPVTLTAPTGSPSASAGPYQAQNALIYLSGTLLANVQVTLPLPGVQRVANFTTGNFVVTLAAPTAGNIVGIPQGCISTVFNNGTNVTLLSDEFPGSLTFLTGVSTLPSWITASSVRPFLLCDGSVYNYSDYPYLSARLQGTFGGNGITTFGVPDLRGRYPLAYDGTGTRITTAGSGLDGQSMGAAGGAQNQTLVQANLPNITLATNITDPGHTHAESGRGGGGGNSGVKAESGLSSSSVYTNDQTGSSTTGITASTPLGGSNTPVRTLPPTQVTGIWVIKT